MQPGQWYILLRRLPQMAPSGGAAATSGSITVCIWRPLGVSTTPTRRAVAISRPLMARIIGAWRISLHEIFDHFGVKDDDLLSEIVNGMCLFVSVVMAFSHLRLKASQH